MSEKLLKSLIVAGIISAGAVAPAFAQAPADTAAPAAEAEAEDDGFDLGWLGLLGLIGLAGLTGRKRDHHHGSSGTTGIR